MKSIFHCFYPRPNSPSFPSVPLLPGSYMIVCFLFCSLKSGSFSFSGKAIMLHSCKSPASIFLPSHWLQVTLVFTVCLLDCMLEACLEVFTEISPLLVRLAMEGELVNDITDDMSESYRGVRHSVCALGFNPRHLLPGPAFVQS